MKKMNARAMEKVNGGVLRLTPEEIRWLKEHYQEGRHHPLLDRRNGNTSYYNSHYRSDEER